LSYYLRPCAWVASFIPSLGLTHTAIVGFTTSELASVKTAER
jgi:hypothetical protein